MVMLELQQRSSTERDGCRKDVGIHVWKMNNHDGSMNEEDDERKRRMMKNLQIPNGSC